MAGKENIYLYITGCQKDNESERAKRLAEEAFFRLYERRARIVHLENGKPYFEGEDRIFVSLSHGDGLCAAAISGSELGVDIELMKGDEDRLLRLARRYFAPDEVEYTAALPIPRFYEIWCKKESYLKYTGGGISSGLAKFSVLSGEGISEKVRFSHFICKDRMLALCSEAEFSGEQEYIPEYIEIN